MQPFNSVEKSTDGYSPCLKQDSAESITWSGEPETRFTFDHVACETVDQVSKKLNELIIAFIKLYTVLS